MGRSIVRHPRCPVANPAVRYHTVTITHKPAKGPRVVCSCTSVPADVGTETFLQYSIAYLENVASQCPHKHHKTVVDYAEHVDPDPVPAPEVPRV